MASAYLSSICLFLLVLVPAIDARFDIPADSPSGGSSCATCSILLGLVDKLTIVYNDSAVRALERICSALPGQYKVYCKVAVEFLGECRPPVSMDIDRG